MSLRVLILSASVGAGHIRAAQAIEVAAREVHPEWEISNVDVMTLTTAGFRRLYSTAYLDLVNKAPHVLGYMYDYFDRPRPEKDRRERLRRAFQKLNMRKLFKSLQQSAWDIAVCTHFLPAEIIAELRKAGKLSMKQVIVTTDFDTHRMWVNEPAEAYTTATEEGKLYLARWGVHAAKIHVTGIPIHPMFSQTRTREAYARGLGITSDRPIVLQLAGGFGVGPIGELYRALLSIQTSVEIIVVCGKNPQARAELEKVPVPPRHRVAIMGFTDRMDELMGCADVVVSKPGGLTTSEVLARGTVLAIINPTPGQETRNSDYVLENGAGVKVNSVAALAYKVERILTDPARLESMRAASRHLGRPLAAYDVVRLTEQLATPTRPAPLLATR